MNALEILTPMLINYLLPSEIFGVDGKVYTFILLSGIVFSMLTLAVMTFRMEKSKLYYSLFIAIGLIALWLISDFNKAITPFTNDIKKWLDLEYFARMMLPLAWLAFSEAYTKRHKPMNISLLLLLFIGYGALYSYFISYMDGFTLTAAATLVVDPAALDLIFLPGYGILIWSVLRLRRFANKLKGVYKKQVNLISAGIFVIAGMDLLFPLKSVEMTFDPVPLAHIVATFFLWRAITKYRLLEVVPIAIREVFNNMNESVLVLNEDGTILDFNRSADELFSHYFDPETDISILDLLKKVEKKITDSDALREAVTSALKNPDGNFSMDTTLLVKPVKYLTVMFGPIYDTRKNPIGHVIVIDDVTDKMALLMENARANHRLSEQNFELEAQTQELEAQKEELMAMNEDIENAMNELKNTQGKLVQSEKMASLGNLVAGIAHEINTPLGSINSNLDINSLLTNRLLSAEGISEENIALIKKIQRTNEINLMACKRILEIVLSLKNFSRLDEADFQKADVHEGLNSTLLLLNNQLKNRITVHKNFGELPLIDCYPNQLNQVFMNILVNAAQAITGEGNIYIETLKKKNRILIRITDSGPGIREEHREKLFDPGFTTKDVGIGTGLGLAICYKIIEGHNGSIHAENMPERGASFVIELPISNITDQKGGSLDV